MKSDGSHNRSRRNRFWVASREILFILKDDPWQASLATLPLLLCIPWNPAHSTRNYEYQLHLAYTTGARYGKEILADLWTSRLADDPVFLLANVPNSDRIQCARLSILDRASLRCDACPR